MGRYTPGMNQPSHNPALDLPLPRTMGAVNWLGLWQLYLKEVRRFWKVIFQTVAAPVITSLMFLLVMVFAFGRSGNIVDVLMPPLSAMELTVAWVMGSVTRGIVVGVACAATMAVVAHLHFHSIGLI